MSESEQARVLLDWMLFSLMESDLPQQPLSPISWKNGYGAEIKAIDWNKEASE